MSVRNIAAVAAMAGFMAVSGAASLGHAQIATSPDSASAVADGKIAAKKELVSGYFLVGVVTGPFALGSLAALASGADPHPVIIGSPLVLFAAGAHAGRVGRLPPRLESTIQQRDSAYIRAFTTSYNATVKKRRQTALGLGALTGVIGSIFLIAVTFRGYTD